MKTMKKALALMLVVMLLVPATVFAAGSATQKKQTVSAKTTVKVSGKTYKKSGNTIKVAYSKKLNKVVTVKASAKTTVKYSVKATGSSKKVAVSGGKITIKKGYKGTITVKMTAKATKAYKSATKTIKIVVK